MFACGLSDQAVVDRSTGYPVVSNEFEKQSAGTWAMTLGLAAITSWRRSRSLESVLVAARTTTLQSTTRVRRLICALVAHGFE